MAPTQPNLPTTAGSERVFRLRMRADLEVVSQVWQGREYRVVKDPLALKYYRFEAEELAILQMLDGKRSAEEIRQEFEQRFAPQRLPAAELFQLAGMFHRSGLVVSDATGQGEQLFQRHRNRAAKERKQAFSNPLAIRFRGIDPGRFLDWLNSIAGWVFSWPFICLSILLGCAAMGLVATNFELLMARMPGFEEFFMGRNWIWLSIVLIITKIAHELGHGLACKRLGGECNEMGMMMLVMMPCLYCNVSDSWMLSGKWKRVAIAAAGMYVELMLATIATFVWWYSQPGTINQVALNVMMVCSISTLLFNANPLMKYDGYYILADIVEIPNLRQKATTLMHRMAADWFLGLKWPADPFLPTRRKWLFVSYSIAAVAYRWLITFSIFWFLYRMLEPWGLKLIGQLLAVMAIWSLCGAPLMQLFRFFKTPGRWMAVKKTRFAASVSVVGLLAIGILMFPVPHLVRCSFFSQPARSQNVFVTLPGFLSEIRVGNGEVVRKGDLLAELSNPDLALEIERLQAELDQADVNLRQIGNQKTRLTGDQATIDEVQSQEATANAAFKLAENRLLQKLQELEKLKIVAPVDGVFVSDSWKPKPGAVEAITKPVSWTGFPLDRRNRGAWLETRTRIGQVVQTGMNQEIILAVDQGDIEFIKPDQKVTLWIRQIPGRVFESRTDRIAPAKMLTVPPALSSRTGGDLVTTRDADGNDVPQSTTWQVSVPIDDTEVRIAGGATGLAHIRVGTQPLIHRIYRELCRTFRFEL